MTSQDALQRARERWDGVWRALGTTPPADTFDALRAAYSEEERAYHTLDHVLACLAELDRAPRAEQPEEVELALWFHDAVYDPKRDDNEARSADWAAEVLGGCGVAPERVARVRELVHVTRHDREPATPDEALVLDIDLAVLGGSAEAFRAYDAGIRHEYAWVPQEAYAQARSRVLRRFLARRPLYHTEALRARYEERARQNLREALEKTRT